MHRKPLMKKQRRKQKVFKGVLNLCQFLICPRIAYNSLNRKSLPWHWHRYPFPLLHHCGSDFQNLSSLRVEVQKFSVPCENSALNFTPKSSNQETVLSQGWTGRSQWMFQSHSIINYNSLKSS